MKLHLALAALAAGVSFAAVFVGCTTNVTNIYELGDAAMDARAVDAGSDVVLVGHPLDGGIDAPASRADAEAGVVDAGLDATPEPWTCDPVQTLDAAVDCRPYRLLDAGCGLVYSFLCFATGLETYQPADAGPCIAGVGIAGATESTCASCARNAANDTQCASMFPSDPYAYSCPVDQDAGAHAGCVRHPTAMAQGFPPTPFPVDCCP